MPVPCPRPSGLSEPGALPLLAGGALAVGVVAGAVSSVVSNALISLVILFPAAVGAAVGGVAHAVIGSRKIRAPLLAAAIAALGGVGGQVVVHRVDYQWFRLEAARQVRAQDPGADADAAIEEFLVGRTGRGGWAGYIAFQAQAGITIKRSSGSFKLEGVGAYLLWLFELLVAAAVAGGMALERARKPFCEHCRRWYDPPADLARGSGDKKAWKAVVAALERGDVAGALAARGEPAGRHESVLRLARCSACEAHVPVLTLLVRPVRQKRKERKRWRGGLRWEETRALLDGAATRQGAQAGVA